MCVSKNGTGDLETKPKEPLVWFSRINKRNILSDKR